MEDAGFIYGAYLITGGAVVAYAVSLVRRIRRTSRELDGGGRQSWT